MKLNPTFPSIKKLIHRHYPTYTHALSPQANTSIPNKSKQPTIRFMHTHNKDSLTRFGKFIETLPDPFIFMDRKNLSIDQWLSKMKGKFEINRD